MPRKDKRTLCSVTGGRRSDGARRLPPVRPARLKAHIPRALARINRKTELTVEEKFGGESGRI
jgi:hypothetical protein